MKDIEKEIIDVVQEYRERTIGITEAKSRLDKLYAKKYAQAIIKVCEDSKKGK